MEELGDLHAEPGAELQELVIGQRHLVVLDLRER